MGEGGLEKDSSCSVSSLFWMEIDRFLLFWWAIKPGMQSEFISAGECCSRCWMLNL